MRKVHANHTYTRVSLTFTTCAMTASETAKVLMQGARYGLQSVAPDAFIESAVIRETTVIRLTAKPLADGEVELT